MSLALSASPFCSFFSPVQFQIVYLHNLKLQFCSGSFQSRMTSTISNALMCISWPYFLGVRDWIQPWIPFTACTLKHAPAQTTHSDFPLGKQQQISENVVMNLPIHSITQRKKSVQVLWFPEKAWERKVTNWLFAHINYCESLLSFAGVFWPCVYAVRQSGVSRQTRTALTPRWPSDFSPTNQGHFKHKFVRSYFSWPNVAFRFLMCGVVFLVCLCTRCCSWAKSLDHTKMAFTDLWSFANPLINRLRNWPLDGHHCPRTSWS